MHPTRRTTSRRPPASAGAALATLATLALGAAALAPASSAQAPLPPVQDFLADQLSGLGALTPTYVMVHGRTIQDAEAAVSASGLQQVTSYDRVGVAVARGTRSQIETARTQPGVTYLEGNTPIDVHPQHLPPGHPRRRGDADPHRRRRLGAEGQGRLASPSSTPASTRPTRSSRSRTARPPSWRT